MLLIPDTGHLSVLIRISIILASVMSEISFCETVRIWHRTVSLSWY